MNDRFYFEVSLDLEDELPAFQERVLPLLVGRGRFLSIEFCNPKGGGYAHPWISIFIDCSKEVAKVLAALLAKELFDYYKNKRAKSKEPERLITIYGPDNHVYKQFLVVGEGKQARIENEKEDFKFLPSDTVT